MIRGLMPGAVQTPNFSVPQYAHPDYRIYEFNKRLQNRPEESETLWWENLINEFFEENAYVHLQYTRNDCSKRCSLNRLLIPRYFRTLFEGGVSQVQIQLYQPSENYLNSTIILDCESASYVTHLTKPSGAEVVTKGHLTVTFTFDELMRIQSWRFVANDHLEMIPRDLIKSKDTSNNIEQLYKSVSENGLLSSTLAYLDFCVVLEPMQEIMSRSKSTNVNPRECLRLLSMQKWHARSMRPDFSPGGFENVWTNNNNSVPARSTPKRKTSKRKQNSTSSTSGAAIDKVTSGHSTTTSKKQSPHNTQNIQTASSNNQSSDFMVVGEPKLLGGEFWYGDERLITRVKNTQYVGSNGIDNGDGDEPFVPSPLSTTEQSSTPAIVSATHTQDIAPSITQEGTARSE